MNLNERIAQIRGRALREIEESARRGDTKSIIANTRIVEESDQLLKKWQALSVAVEFLEKGGLSTENQYKSNKGASLTPNTDQNDDLPPKIRGDMRRKELLRYLSMTGIHLDHKSGSAYLTSDKKLVGIAYASERRPNRWFLGLPDTDYDAVILICDSIRGDDQHTCNIVISKSLYSQFRQKLSKVGDQIKYNIVMRRNILMLLIPSDDPIPINGYVDNYEPLVKVE